jgi:DNA-binding transcriptional LysR family regulator
MERGPSIAPKFLPADRRHTLSFGRGCMSIYDHLEFRHLKYIVAVAEQGTFTAASLSVPVAQSALSRQIADIEEIFNIQIFERVRGGTGVSLTPAGEALLTFACQLLQTRMEIIEAVQAIHQSTLLPFRLGFSPLVEEQVVDTVCHTYQELFPRSDIRPEGADTEELFERLIQGTIDAALVTLPVAGEGIKVKSVMHQPLVVCIPEDDTLAQLTEIPPAALNGKLSIFCDPRQHPRAHARLLEALNEKGIILRLTHPTFNADHVQWMVKERICYALIREDEPLREGLTTRPIQGLSFTVDSAIAYKSDGKQLALPLLLRELEKRFPLANTRSPKKPPTSVSYEPAARTSLVSENDPAHEGRTPRR